MDDLRIDPEEARELKNAFYVDARNPQAWGDASTKIPGAIRIPANALESHLSEVPRDRPIVTYCTWPNEGSSASLAQHMRDAGFTNARALRGGYDAWIQRGYPVEPK